MSFAVDRAGVPGLRRHRSHEIVPVEKCLIAHDLITAADVTSHQWPSAQSVEVSVVPATGERGVLVAGPVASGRLPDVPADTLTLARKHGSRIPVRGRGYLTQQRSRP